MAKDKKIFAAASAPPAAKKPRWKLRVFLVVLAGLAAWFWFGMRGERELVLKADSFSYAKVEPRTIAQSVSANGNINPVNVVNVGAQVSGIIERIYVDFNDAVKIGQLLAVIDKATLLEELAASRAKVAQALAAEDLAKRNKARAQELYDAGYTARIELDQANVEAANAESNLVSARAALKRAEINIGYAEIRSPVAGVVISRDVEKGQTIASSFSAPTLFKIAEDLKKMQIETSISEADIGNIRPGQKVDFSVDAFPLETFGGVVDQVRLNPKTEQNVVVYNVIIKIDNKDGRLLPGMTAFVEIKTREENGVPAVPVAALQYRPEEAILAKVAYPENRRLAVGEAFLYVFDAASGGIKALKIRRGISDGKWTQVISPEIADGAEVITDSKAAGGKKGASGGAAAGRDRQQGGQRGGPGGGPGGGGMRL